MFVLMIRSKKRREKMLKRDKSAIIFCLCVFLVNACYAFDREEISEGISGQITCIESVDGTDKIFAGTENGLYMTNDMGKEWIRADIPGSHVLVKDLAFDEKNIFLATDAGIYQSKNINGEALWKRSIGKKDVSGIAVTRAGEKGRRVLGWKDNRLFYLADNDQIEMFRVWGGSNIIDVVCEDGVMFLAAGGDIFISSDSGEKWKKIQLLRGARDIEEYEDRGDGEEGFASKSLIKNLYASGSGRVTVATIRGIFRVYEGRVAEIIDTTGLPSNAVTNAVDIGSSIFASTDKKIFFYSDKEKYWKQVFAAEVPCDITILRLHRDAGGRKWLLAGCGRYIYKCDVDKLLSSGMDHRNEGEGYDQEKEVSVLDVQRMAIEYAEVSPDKIKKWREGAKWKAIMPKLSLDFSKSIDDNVEIYKNSSTSYSVIGPQETDTDWSIDLTWDLSDLVWNDVQTSIDVRSKLMVQLRDEILEEVTRLFFERKRAMVEIAIWEENPAHENGSESHKALWEKKMRSEELTAYIDALTGGGYSEALNTGKINNK